MVIPHLIVILYASLMTSGSQIKTNINLLNVKAKLPAFLNFNLSQMLMYTLSKMYNL